MAWRRTKPVRVSFSITYNDLQIPAAGRRDFGFSRTLNRRSDKGWYPAEVFPGKHVPVFSKVAEK